MAKIGRRTPYLFLVYDCGRCGIPESGTMVEMGPNTFNRCIEDSGRPNLPNMNLTRHLPRARRNHTRGPFGYTSWGLSSPHKRTQSLRGLHSNLRDRRLNYCGSFWPSVGGTSVNDGGGDDGLRKCSCRLSVRNHWCVLAYLWRLEVQPRATCQNKIAVRVIVLASSSVTDEY